MFVEWSRPKLLKIYVYIFHFCIRHFFVSASYYGKVLNMCLPIVINHTTEVIFFLRTFRGPFLVQQVGKQYPFANHWQHNLNAPGLRCLLPRALRRMPTLCLSAFDEHLITSAYDSSYFLSHCVEFPSANQYRRVSSNRARAWHELVYHWLNSVEFIMSTAEKDGLGEFLTEHFQDRD